MSAYGLTPDDWQRLVLDDWLAESKTKWASLTCGLAVPRQNGKNGLIEMREVFGMVGLGERILHTAHEVKTAQKAFKRLKFFFGNQVNDPAARFPELNRRVVEVRSVNGQEAIVLDNGGAVEIVARSKNSGRGFTVDVLVLDEAQELDDDSLEALMPTTSAAPLGNPQWIYTGTPPGPNARGDVFTRVRKDALSGESARLAWHEWSAEPGVDMDDRNVWRATNPALITGRLQMAVLEGERARYSDDGFGRERLGMWSVEGSKVVIPAAAWLDRKTKSVPPNGTPPTALAVDMSHDRVTAIAGCWSIDDARHVELLAQDRTFDTSGPLQWLVERAGRRIPVVIDSYSPAASLIPDLKARKVKVIVTNAGDMAKACGGFYADVVTDQSLSFPDRPDQQPVTDAVATATKRKIGDAGGWGWDRKDPTVNIAPLVAVTLARFGAVVSKKKSTGPSRIVVLS